MDETACNYDGDADYDDGSCWFAEPWYDCEGICLDDNSNGICDVEESGCTDAEACNYDSEQMLMMVLVIFVTVHLQSLLLLYLDTE